MSDSAEHSQTEIEKKERQTERNIMILYDKKIRYNNCNGEMRQSKPLFKLYSTHDKKRAIRTEASTAQSGSANNEKFILTV